MIGIEDQRRAGKPADGQNGDAVRLAPGDPQIVPRQETVKRAAGGLIERFLTVMTWSWQLVIGAWLLLRPAMSPARS